MKQNADCTSDNGGNFYPDGAFQGQETCDETCECLSINIVIYILFIYNMFYILYKIYSILYVIC